MTGKGRELADMMERRKVDILCVQETRWKGSKARSIGAGFKLFYYGVDSKRNGVGVVLKEEFVRNVLEVKRVSDRVMSLKLEIEGVMLNVVSGYAPQVGCELENKERFRSELDEVMESIPTGERVVIEADFNGHVGEGNTGDEEVMGKFGVKERNLEGQMVVDFAKRMDMAVVNTYFQKREEHRVTYKSGGRRTQVVLPDDWETTAEVIRETGRKVLGVSSGRRKEDKETWWWNEEVQDSIQRKRLAKKKWDMDRTEENRQEYKELQRRVKREVSKAKQKAYDELYTRLDTREGEKVLYGLARQRDRDGKDVQQVRVIKDRDGRVLTSEESVQKRWKEYFEELMNEENEREKRVEGVNSVEQKVDKIRKDEVRKALKRMKSGKAVGPDDIPVEVWKCLGEAAVEFLASLFNRVLESEKMPEEWRRSVLVPIFKNKGDVQSCSNYRGIKLMSHTMKVWERVVEARLRKVVEICEQQYGFMPRKSTTDAIFALRILMEKYRDGQRELHCVFVDLEKAYDRVPREELWYCMRKSGVAEKYVRVVQDMYERSRTVVRCAVGQTEEFNVEVGLHQGSALSSFLFAIVMDQLSEEVRQESPWTMMFADDIVICSESREQVEVNLERWRFALERRGMKVSCSKTEYMCVNEREGSGTVRLQGEEVKKVQEFKYLGSTVQSNGECGKEVKKRVQAGWNGWRKVSGVLCDRKISARIKGKVYRTVVRLAMLYGLETVSLRKRQESELEVVELKMLRFSLGVTRLDRIRNEYIRGTAHVGRIPCPIIIAWAVGKLYNENEQCWFGKEPGKYMDYIYQGPVIVVLLINFVFLFNIVRILMTKLRASTTSETIQYRRRHFHPRSRGHVSRNLIYPPLLSQSQTVVVGGLWNCQSAIRKADFISALASHYSFDFLALTETWISPQNTATPAALSSAYTFSHSPRESGRGGGTVSVTSPINLFIIVIYRPPGPLGNFLDEMDTLLSVFPSDSTPLTVLGDFNLPSDKLHSSGLLALLNSFSLSFNSCPPTHKEGNVLDLVFTHPSPATDMTVTPLHISDHHLVSFSITLPVLPKRNPQHLSLTRRNLHSISPSSVASCTLSSLPDHESFSSLPLDSATDTLLSSLSSTMDFLCPLSTIRRKNSSPAPWLSDVLRNNRRELRSAARKWKKSKLDTDLTSYRTLLSKFSLDVTSAKTSFYKEKLETSAQDPRKLHNIFSSLLNPPAPPSPSSLTAEDFASFYTEKIERFCQTFTSFPTSPTSHNQHSATPSLTQLSTVAAEEVLQITRSCNPTTCPLDPIPSAMLQTISPDLLPFITTVINGSLTSGHVPTAFKKARVIPILKKPALDPSDISNYRPVSLLSFLSKILERVVCNQLSDYLMQNNLHDPNQSGFKAAHSTETALLAVTEKLHAARSAKLSSVLILLDLSAAFDTVNHKTLLSTLRSLGICGTAWEWFASYLDGRSYQVTWKGLTSAPRRLSSGVPQGSVLGPLLFSLYTHSLGKVISSHGFSYHCYADDTQLIFSFPPSDTTASARISTCLADISSWMTAHQLKLNPSKTELLIIPGDPSPAQDLAISLSNSMISPTASARNLGVTMDNQLSFSSHVTNVTRSCRFLLYNIRRIRPFLSTQATQVLVQSLVISRLDYCNSLLAGLPLNAIRPLQMIQNAAARLVFNLPKFSHTTPLLRSLHWLPVAARIRFKTLMLAYKAKNGPAPSYLKALVTSRTAPRLLRSTSTARLVPPSLREKGRKAVKATLVLLPLLGITYMLFFVNPGDDDISQIVFIYFNSFLQSFQGFFVSVFYCFLNGEVRSAVRKRWHRWQDNHALRVRVARAMSIPTSPTRISFHSIKHTTAV
ncbi:hypothetical protein QTP86_012679 [Hemibagrus guttatus]|nr:hypothetical protein QTP86_012679 [Hemibagrus guttatus]